MGVLQKPTPGSSSGGVFVVSDGVHGWGLFGDG